MAVVLRLHGVTDLGSGHLYRPATYGNESARAFQVSSIYMPGKGWTRYLATLAPELPEQW